MKNYDFKFFKINPMPSAHVAQSVERVLGKDEVGGSNPLVGSTYNINKSNQWPKNSSNAQNHM